MSTATLTKAQERALRTETKFATTPSPRLKAQMKEQREREVESYLAEKKAGYEQAEATAAAQKAVQEPVQVPAVPFVPASQDEPWGKLQAVLCPLEGYEGVTVHYRTNNRHGVIRKAGELAEGDMEAFYNWCMLFVKRIDWPTPNSMPDLTTREAWKWLENNVEDFMTWMLTPGYRTAKEQALGGATFRG